MPDLPRFVPAADSRPVDEVWPAITWPPTSPELVGRGVRLTRVDPPADAAALFTALDDDRVWAHLAGRPISVEDCERRLVARQLEPGCCQWLVRAGSAVVGTSSYLDCSPTDARLEIGSTSYSPAVWGTAVNPAVKLLLLDHAFTTLGAGRVQLKTDVRNTRSQQAIARLGARYEGTLRRYQRRADGTVRDTAMFSITAEEWPAVRDRLERRLAESSDSR